MSDRVSVVRKHTDDFLKGLYDETKTPRFLERRARAIVKYLVEHEEEESDASDLELETDTDEREYGEQSASDHELETGEQVSHEQVDLSADEQKSVEQNSDEQKSDGQVESFFHRSFEDLLDPYSSSVRDYLMKETEYAYIDSVPEWTVQLETENESVQAPSVQAPSGLVPSGQVPSVQAPSVQTPSGQVSSVQAPSVQTPLVQALSGQAPSVQGTENESVQDTESESEQETVISSLKHNIIFKAKYSTRRQSLITTTLEDLASYMKQLLFIIDLLTASAEFRQSYVRLTLLFEEILEAVAAASTSAEAHQSITTDFEPALLHPPIASHYKTLQSHADVKQPDQFFQPADVKQPDQFFQPADVKLKKPPEKFRFQPAYHEFSKILQNTIDCNQCAIDQLSFLNTAPDDGDHDAPKGALKKLFVSQPTFPVGRTFDPIIDDQTIEDCPCTDFSGIPTGTPGLSEDSSSISSTQTSYAANCHPSSPHQVVEGISSSDEAPAKHSYVPFNESQLYTSLVKSGSSTSSSEAESNNFYYCPQQISGAFHKMA
uniref:Uncharacterized protein n=1 Tax=Amphimedon queenslandica TaxID=400682 RepID=A0A1X7TZ33_AMPQE